MLLATGISSPKFASVKHYDSTRHPGKVSGVKSNIIVNINFNKTLADPSDGYVGNIVYIAVVIKRELRYDS